MDGRPRRSSNHSFFSSDGCSLNQRNIGVDSSGFQRFSAKPSRGGLLDGARWFTLPICCYCRSRLVRLQTQLCSFPQQQPMRGEMHTGEGIQNVMILDDLHYSLRNLANVCVCVCVCVCVDGGLWIAEATGGRKTTSIWWSRSTEPLFPSASIPNNNPKYLTTQHTHMHSWCIGKVG